MNWPRPHPLAVLRIGFAVAWLFALGFAGLTMWTASALPASAWAPVGPARLVGGAPSTTALSLLWLAAVAATVALGLGWKTRVASGAALAGSVVVMAVHNSLGKLDHGWNLGLLFLAVFHFSDWGRVGGMDARRRLRSGEAGSDGAAPPDARGALDAFLAVAALCYFAGALVKVVRGHFLQSGRLEAFLRGANAGGAGAEPWMQGILGWFLEHRLASDALGWASLALELGVGAALLGRPFRMIVAGGLAMFHAGIALLTGIAFLTNIHLWILVALAAWLGDGPPGTPLRARRVVLQGSVLVAAVLGAVAVARWLPGDAGLGAVDVVAEALVLLTRPLQWPLLVPLEFLVGLAASVVGVMWILIPAARAARLPLPDARHRVFLYDGGCGFCKRWCDWAERRTGTAVSYQPCQEATELRAAAGIPDAACLHAAHYVEQEHGRILGLAHGAGAINAVLGRFRGASRAPWRVAALAYRLGGIRQAQDLGYRLVAANRHRIGDDACAVAPAALDTEHQPKA